MEELIPIFAIFFTIGVPVMAAAAHFVLRPMIKDLAIARKGDRQEGERSLEHRISRIEDVLVEQNQQIDKLLEAELFRRQLETGQGSGRPAAKPEEDR